MKKRKNRHIPLKKSVRQKQGNTPPKAKKQFAKTIRWILGLVISAVGGGIITYYLSTVTPDIRPIRDQVSSLKVAPIQDKENNCVYYYTIVQRFKNLSFKSGHIEKVDIMSFSEELIPDFKVVDINKMDLKRGEEAEIHVTFSMTLDQHSCRIRANSQNPINIGTKYYDNTGKLLNTATDDQPFYLYSDLRLPGQNSTRDLESSK